MTVDTTTNGTRPGAELTLRQPTDIAMTDEFVSFVETYPGLSPEIDMDELVSGALGEGEDQGIRLGDLTRIKVPAGDIDELQVPNSETGRTSGVEWLEVIPVGTTERRSYWASSEPNGSAPDCKSTDMINGVGMFGPGSPDNPDGLCKGCPMAEFGSATKGEGTACKQQRLMFLLVEGEILPILLIVPPGSLKSYRDFGMVLIKSNVKGPIKAIDSITGRAKRGPQWMGVKVKISLEKKTNGAGQVYNVLKFKIGERLDEDQKVVVGAYANFVTGLMEAQADQLDDVAAGAAGGGGGPAAGSPVAGDGDFDDEGLPQDDVTVPAGKSGKSTAKS